MKTLKCNIKEVCIIQPVQEDLETIEKYFNFSFKSKNSNLQSTSPDLTAMKADSTLSCVDK